MRRILRGLAGIWVFGPLMAALEFEQTTREVHAAIDAAVVATEFPFRNTGSGKAVISRSEAACSCIGVEVKGGKLEYAPGEAGVIRGVFELGNFTGSVEKAILVWVEGDGEDDPSIQLTVRVHIPEPIKIDSRTLRWDLGEPADAKSISVRMEGEEPIRITEVSCGNEAFEVGLETVKEGRDYRVKVRPVTTQVPGLAVVRIATDSPISRLASQQVFAVVRASREP